MWTNSIVASLLLVAVMSVRGEEEIKGPPRSVTREMKKIGHLGDTVKLQCPIEGFPAPIIEWTKGGEKIDFTWERYKMSRKVLKIRYVNADDTGVFGCKGINGFGSEYVRIELIIVDPAKYPSIPDSEGVSIDLAPPVFTEATKKTPKTYRLAAGDSFKLDCEALGSPEPQVRWLRNGQIIQNNHLPSSTLELSFVSQADSGIYTCEASNLLNSVFLQYTVEVIGSSMGRSQLRTSLTEAVVVTEAGPVNLTVTQGSPASLFCRIKSIGAVPQVQWLKKLDFLDTDDPKVLTVGSDRFRVLDSSLNDVSIESTGKYISKLTFSATDLEDNGMYICFVANGGIGQVSYMSAHLKVTPALSAIGPGSTLSSMIIVLISCSTLTIILLSTALILCCIRLKKVKPGQETPPDSRLSSACEARPFLMYGDKYYPATVQGPAGTSTSTTVSDPNQLRGQWSGNLVYPLSSFHHPNSNRDQLVSHALHTFGDYENVDQHLVNPFVVSSMPHLLNSEPNNVYEVPYSHLFKGDDVYPKQDDRICYDYRVYE